MRSLITLLLCSVALSGCLRDDCTDTVTYTAFHPVILSAVEWRSDDFTFDPPAEVCDPSGFYVYGDILLVLDRSSGLHILDNSDNEAPKPLRFIEIPGGEGLAVRNDVLYVNQYVDLLAFDLSDPAAPKFLSRTENVFDPHSNFATGVMGNGDIQIGFTEGTETMTVDCSSPFFDRGWLWQDDVTFAADRMALESASFAQRAGAPATGGDRVGVGGSLARFTINQGTLYAVDHNTLRTFSLEKPTEPDFIGITQLGWGIETIFPYKDMLFIGANNGMHIYGVSDPLSPQFFSTFEHVRSCDPVVVQNDIAYVTMWGGSECGAVTDQLMVLDVENPRRPRQLQEIPMLHSHGLGVDDDKLFLCAGPEGMKTLELLPDGTVGSEQFTTRDFPAKDVIVLPAKQELIVLGWERAGIKQFDYDAEGRATAVSHLNVCD